MTAQQPREARLELEEELERLSRQRTLELAQSLLQIRLKSFSIWDSQRLVFFTDHRAQTHSVWLIRTLGRLLHDFQSNSSEALNAAELFVLLSACYLHDIGMQDFRVDGRPVEEFTIADYKQIRQRHPERGRELILQTRDIPMPSQTFRRLVALVSQGHGSDFFKETLEKLDADSSRPADCRVRGGLLAALLLIADELHLSEERAVFPEGLDLSPMSSLHFHANHYVTGIEFEDRAEGVLAKLTMEFPEEANAYRYDLMQWIVNKLVRQIRRVNPVLRRATNGVLGICEYIVVRDGCEPVRGLRRALPDRDQRLLHREVVESLIVDREELISRLRKLIRHCREEFCCVFVNSGSDSDWPVLLRKIFSETLSSGFKIGHVSFDTVAGMSSLDILTRIKESYATQGVLLEAAEAPAAFGRESMATHAFITDLDRCSEDGLILVIEHPGRADDVTKTWLYGDFLPAFDTLRPRLGLVVLFEEGDPFELNSPKFRLDPYRYEDIREHCEKVLGYARPDAEEEARLLYGASLNGTPAGVLAGLAVQRSRELILERQK